MPDEESRFWFASYVDERLRATNDMIGKLDHRVSSVEEKVDRFQESLKTIEDVAPMLHSGKDVIDFSRSVIRFFNSAKKIVAWFIAASVWFWSVTHTGDVDRVIGYLWPF